MLSLKKIVSASLRPLLYLNLAGMTAGALWLGLEDQWQVVGFGVPVILFSPFVIPILLVPAGIFSHLMSLARQAGQASRERILFMASLGYIIFFMAFWCSFAFARVTYAVAPSAREAGLLWACTLAEGPLLWWASRDPNNTFIITLVEVCQLGLLLLAALVAAHGLLAFWTSFAIFGALLAGVALMQAVYEEKFMKKPAPPA